MTGRELIIYILQNNLEDEIVLGDGFIAGFMTESEFAEKCSVGIETVRLWNQLGIVNGFNFNCALYFRKDTPDPLKGVSTNEQ